MSVMSQNYSKELEKAAKNGDIEAQCDLGICYYEGLGVKQNDKKGEKWILESVSGGNPKALYYWGKLLEKNKTYDDSIKARRCYERASEKEYAPAQYSLYKSLLSHRKEQAIKWLKKSAEGGCADAQYQYGLISYKECMSVIKEQKPTILPSEDRAYAETVEQLRAILNSGMSIQQLKDMLYENIKEGNTSERELINTLLAMAVSNEKIELPASTNTTYNYLSYASIMKEPLSWFEKSAAQGNEDAKAFLVRMKNEEREYVQRMEQEKLEMVKADKQLAARLRPYHTIKLEKPNTILSVLPTEILAEIDSLTIIGFMYETDLMVLNDCKELQYLDLSQTYITYSPEKQKQIAAEGQYLASMFKFMGEAADAKYNDFEMSTLDHAYVKGFAKLLENSVVKEADAGCLMPSEALRNMPKLETIILPTRASKIGDRVLHGCSALRSVKLPPYIESIGRGAFAYCVSLTSIDFPSTLNSIGYFDEEDLGYNTGDGSFVVTNISKFDFSKCNFRGNYSKTHWAFNFRKCPVKELYLPNGVNNITLRCQEALPGARIYVPANVVKLDARFYTNVEIHFKSNTPPKQGDSKLNGCTVYVPKGCTTAYYAEYGNSNKYIEE